MAQAPTYQTNGVVTTEITYAMETIDAAAAKEYLDHNKDNRKESDSWVRTLSLRQKRGEWIFTGDPIRFDNQGYLRDGQHRLRMVTKTGVPIQAMVIRGLDPDVFMVMDTGKKRDLDTVLDILDKPHSGPLAGVIKDVWAYLADQRLSGISHKMYLNFLEEHPDIIASVTFYQERKGHENAKMVKFPKALMVTHYLLSQIDRDKADDFIERLIYGADTSGPLVTLRNALIKWARPASHLRRGTDPAAIHSIIHIWNLIEEGKETRAQVRTPQADTLKSPRSIIPNGFPKELFIPPDRQLALIGMLEIDEESQDNTDEEES